MREEDQRGAWAVRFEKAAVHLSPAARFHDAVKVIEEIANRPLDNRLPEVEPGDSEYWLGVLERATADLRSRWKFSERLGR